MIILWQSYSFYPTAASSKLRRRTHSSRQLEKALEAQGDTANTENDRWGCQVGLLDLDHSCSMQTACGCFPSWLMSEKWKSYVFGSELYRVRGRGLSSHPAVQHHRPVQRRFHVAIPRVDLGAEAGQDLHLIESHYAAHLPS